MSLRWWIVCSTLLTMAVATLLMYLGAATHCPGLPDGHEWVSDCDTALEKLEIKTRDETDA